MVELIPKQAKKPLFSLWFFLIASMLVFVSMVVVFFVLGHVIRNNMQILEGLEQRLSRDTTPQEKALASELVEYQTKIDAFAFAIEKRYNFSPLFDVLERSTHEGVVFESFEANRDEKRINVVGKATGFFILEQQRLLWEQEEGIVEARLAEIRLEGNGEVGFEAEFLVDPNLEAMIFSEEPLLEFNMEELP